MPPGAPCGSAPARRMATEARMRKQAEAERTKARQAEAAGTARQVEELGPWLRALGFRDDDVRRAVALCAAIPEASLEERLKHALRSLAPACARHTAPVASSPA